VTTYNEVLVWPFIDETGKNMHFSRGRTVQEAFSIIPPQIKSQRKWQPCNQMPYEPAKNYYKAAHAQKLM
jgi:hypothetical protein